MKKMIKLKESLAERASVLRIPPEIRIPIVEMFVRLVEKNGEEWAVSRFKSVKVDFLRVKAGQPIATKWISKRNNTFKGPLGGLQRWASRDSKSFDAAIQLLQIYTWFISSDVTQSQSMKFVDAVQSDVDYHQYFNAYSDILLHATRQLFPFQSTFPDPESLLFRPVSDTKREPHASGCSFEEGVSTLKCAQSFLDGTIIGRQLVEKYPILFAGVMSGVATCVSARQRIDHGDYHNIVGKIGLIQEPGYKLRAVANPARVYQQALKPLGDDLYGKLKDLPWDCTHNQSYPFSTIQKHLREGKTAHAVDLSNATDKFPFELQYRMLHVIYRRKDAIELFADLSRAAWYTSLTSSNTITWTVGQPLGLYPSFASFAMTHGVMLFALNGCAHNDAFYVLGDDVVILDDGLHAKYMRFLINLGIPYAESKTLSSNIITEFGGKIFTSDRIIPQLKWRRVSDDSFIDLARVVGERFRSLLLPRQRRVFDIVKVIPDFLGGCGFNPQGLPLETRVRLYYDKLQNESLQPYLLSYNGRVNALLYERFSPCGSSERRMLSPTLPAGTWFYAHAPLETFDQNVLRLAESIPISFILSRMISMSGVGANLPRYHQTHPWKTTFGSLLSYAYPRERSLRFETQGQRHTTLEVLERKLLN